MWKTTFVSAIFDLPLYNPNRGVEYRIKHFKQIASTGIPFCVFTCPIYHQHMIDISKQFPNVFVFEARTMEDTRTNKMSCVADTSLPLVRNEQKDTREYMILMNSKIEFVNIALRLNPWNTPYFAWIDLSINFMFKNPITPSLLKSLAMRQVGTPFFAIPGCWSTCDNIDSVLSRVHWRFCGNFFIGDAQSISHFGDLFNKYYPLFLTEHKRQVWEVNFWAWLEWKHGDEWRPTWYSADHNDSIIKVPSYLSYTKKLVVSLEGSVVTTYKYPSVKNFTPSSASFLKWNGYNILNTRYVNYTLTPKGGYEYPQEHGNTIITNNLLSFLPNDYCGEIQNIAFMKDTLATMTIYSNKIQGFEDMRLFEMNGEVHFAASNYSLIQANKSRIVYGKYNITEHAITDINLTEPPDSASSCEKNWIPFVNTTISPSRLSFIYKWYPYQSGSLDKDGRLVIDRVMSMPTDFEKIRGSTVFVRCKEYSYGIVHFCEEGHPRYYFHMLVVMDSHTMTPIKYSSPFIFEKLGIEFCIGFDLDDTYYYFWISRHDRDPVMIRINRYHILCDMVIQQPCLT